MDNAHQLNVW